ncbi:MAG: ABC transporter ATP-binding protein [Syntrophomonadaceae bacterium]|jgi:ABC-2 type transport system ATP-binding protein
MIELKEVTKRFGKTVALDSINLSFSQGRIYGLFGPNGAGKSTTLKIIAGLNNPDAGTVTVDGASPRRKRQNIAYLPEIDYLYPWWTIKQAADFVSAFYPDWDKDKYEDLVGFLKLHEDMKIGKISKGQRAKAKLLLTVARKSPYLLMDEPLSGIDILTREEIINTLIRDYREGEQTIIICTHEINDIEGLVDDVIFIHNGRAILTGNVEQLRQDEQKSLVEIMKEVFRYAE